MNMRLSISVGTLLGRYKVGIRKCEDGSINILVNDSTCSAVFMRVQSGLCMLESNFNDSAYREILGALEANLVYIDRRCIELTEAEMRIPYTMVCKEDGNVISVGQSNNLVIYIVIENTRCKAIFQYTSDSIKYIRSTYPADQTEHIRNLILHNIKEILQVMCNKGMIDKDKSTNINKGLYMDGFASKMTEVGKVERTRVDKAIEAIFADLDMKGYSNLEVQSMLLESVFEISLRHRTSVN